VNPALGKLLQTAFLILAIEKFAHIILGHFNEYK